MDFSYNAVMEAAILVCTLSIDSFAVSFAYGSTGARIPFKSVQVINITCSALLALSLFAGAFVKRFIPPETGAVFCFSILLIIGGIKLAQSILSKTEKKDGGFVKILRPAEAAILAVGLSIDGLAVGFAAALGSVNAVVMIAVSLFSDVAAVMLGCYAGRRVAQKVKFNVAWLGGAILIILAFTKLL